MNERIRELAYEAEDYADSIVDQGGEFHPAYTQKFAELIVRECSRVLEIKGAETGQEPYYYGASLIEKHFGVEE